MTTHIISTLIPAANSSLFLFVHLIEHLLSFLPFILYEIILHQFLGVSLCTGLTEVRLGSLHDYSYSSSL